MATQEELDRFANFYRAAVAASQPKPLPDFDPSVAHTSTPGPIATAIGSVDSKLPPLFPPAPPSENVARGQAASAAYDALSQRARQAGYTQPLLADDVEKLGMAMAAAPAPPPRQYAPVAAMQAATARDLGLPQSLRPKGGMDYGVDYDARVDAALAAGEITPEKAAAAKAQYAKFRETPLGLQFESMRAEPQLVQDIGRLKLEQMSTEERLSERAAEAQAKVDAQLADSERIYAEQRKATEAELVGKQREMDAIRADIAATKIDPQNYFSSAPAWAKVLSILSVGIGGFASGWSGGRIPNTALAQLNAAIDRDIEAQKANLAKKRGEFSAAQGVYAQVRQKLGDDEQAYNFTRALLLNQGARAAQALAGEGRTAGIRNTAAQFSEQLKFQGQQAERNALSVVLQQQLAERKRQAAAAFAASPAGRAAAAASDEARLRKERLKELKGEVEEAELTRKLVEATGGTLGKQPEERMVQLGQYGEETFIAPTVKAADELATRQSAATDFRNTVDAMLAAARTGYLPGGATATSRDINALHATAASQLARSQAGGRTTEQDEQRAMAILPKPAALIDTGEQQVLRTLQRAAQGNVEAYRQAVGAKRITSETVSTPFGPMQRQSLSPDQPKPITFTPAK